MKKLLIVLVLLLPVSTVAANKPKIAKPFTEDIVKTMLYDAELENIVLVKNGECFNYTANDIIYKKQVKDTICPDKTAHTPR